jgi:hypothetical protein
MPTDNQVERVLGGVRGHVGSIRDVTRIDRESSNRVSPVREPVALDRSKRPPRSVARQAAFLGETEPRAARPLGASLRVRQLGAIRTACQRNRSPRFVGCRSGLGAVLLSDPVPAKRGRREEGLPNLRCADGNWERREREFGRCLRYTRIC